MRQLLIISVLAGGILTGAAQATDLPPADAGFDWNRAYAGIFGAAQAEPGPAFGAGAGFDVGVDSRFEFLLTGARLAVRGTVGGAGDSAALDATGRLGVLLSDDLLVYGAGGLGVGLVPNHQAVALVGAGVEMAVGNDLSIDTRLMHAVPMSGANASEQFTIGANLHL